ncbi:putative RNA-directed DNA polymerase from transposon X-element [Trichonephila clavipes]|nr:putative RNA-directed DNA polymerase from transposon X-element [Trichonephila clavipes]
MASPEIFQPIIPLLGLTEKITAGFQRGRSTGAVFLDIQKAFDRVWKENTTNTAHALFHTTTMVSETKYLGLILDKKLTWKQHLTHKRDKFRKALRALYPLIGWNSELNMYNKILLYTAVLRPILTYGSPVWGYAADSNIKIIEVAQNSIIRNIVKADRYTKNSYIYKDIKNFAAKTVPVTTPPCHFQPTNQDSLSNQGPPTSGHIHKIRYGMEERFAFHFPSDDQRPAVANQSVPVVRNEN